MKIRNLKTALSKLFSRAETPKEVWENLTYSDQVFVVQLCLIAASAMLLVVFALTGNLPCGIAGALALVMVVIVHENKEQP